MFVFEFGAGLVAGSSALLADSLDMLGDALSVVAAAGLVALCGSLWPDVIVSLAIATLFLRSAWTIIQESLAALRPQPYRGEGWG